MKIRIIHEWIEESNTVQKVALLISVLTLFTTWFCFSYCDPTAFINWTISFWDVVFNKTSMGFYEYSALGMHNNGTELFGWGGSLLMLLPSIVWDFPIWIRHNIIDDPYCLYHMDIMWHNLLFVIYLIAFAFVCYDVAQSLKPSKNNTVLVPILIGAAEMITSVAYAGQDEIVYFLFMMIALKGFINNNDKGFLVMLSLTICLNPTMLILALPLIMIKERRPIFLILKVVGILSPNILFNILYSKDKFYVDYSQNISDLYIHTFLTEGTFPGSAQLFVTVFVISTVWIFMNDNETIENKFNTNLNIFALWISGVISSSFCLLISGYLMNFYRSFFYLPFFLLIMAYNEDSNENMFCIFAIMISRALHVCPAVVSSQYLSKSSIFGSFFSMIKDKEPLSIWGMLGDISPVLNNNTLTINIAVAIAVFFLYQNMPGKVNTKQSKFFLDYNLSMILSVLIMPVLLIALYLNLV